MITRAWVNVNDTEPFDKNETLKKAGKFNFDDNVTKENFQCAFKEAKIAAKMPLEERKQKYCFLTKQMSKKKSKPKRKNSYSQYSQIQYYPMSQ